MTSQPPNRTDSTPKPPFGMRFLTLPDPSPAKTTLSGGYDEALQMNVTADGNPWHALATGDTQTETDRGDGGPGSGSDSGTDLY